MTLLGFLGCGSSKATTMAVEKSAPTISVGEFIPSDLEVQTPTWPPKTVNLANYVKGKSVIIVGLPGAFTPV